MSRVVPVVTIFKPSFAALDGQEPSAGSVSKHVLENKSIGFKVGREIVSQAHSQELSALLQHQFKFFYACCSINVVSDIVRRVLS